MTSRSGGLTRRALLAGAGMSTLAACGVGGDGDDAGGGRRLVSGSFRSARMAGHRVGFTIAYPPGHAPGDRLPVVVSLHGRGASHATSFATLRLDRVLDAVVRSGVPPFALTAVDGGDHGYWHARADGTDAGAMVTDELVPMLRRRGLDVARLGLYGWSMGGYGALLLAGRRQLPVRAVAVASPALFSAAGTTPPGAFDDAQDFLRNDVFSHPERLAGVPVRIDCGRSDPFYRATRDFVARLGRRPAGEFGAGAHDPAYWRSVAPAELAFLGRRLRG